MPLEVHLLMKHAHDQHAILGLAVALGIDGSFDLLVAGANMDRVASKVWKLRQP